MYYLTLTYEFTKDVMTCQKGYFQKFGFGVQINIKLLEIIIVLCTVPNTEINVNVLSQSALL
jgi:hypothetical protein